MEFENISIDIEERKAVLTINRPKKLNALNRATLMEISDALDDLATDDDVRVVIMTGSGEKAFVAGADIAEFADFSVEKGQQLSADGHKNVFDKIENFPKPVIAAVNGFALGGGLELAMAAHFRTASDNAKMGLPETSLGVIPGYGGTQRLPQLVGKGKAMEMIMTAGMIKADQALTYGLVNYVFSLEDLIEQTKTLAGKIINNSGDAISSAIQAVNDQFQSDKNGYETEIEHFGNAFGTEEFQEGTSAFLDKRKPKFK
jgi:enoyl-CoA hydratase